MKTANELTAQLKEIMATVQGIGVADVVTLDENSLQSTVYHNGSKIGYIGFEGNIGKYFYEVYDSLTDAYIPVYYSRLTECVHCMLVAKELLKK